MSFSMQAGQKKTLTIVFTDNATPPVQHPLGAVPTCVETTVPPVGAVIAPVGTQTPTDAQYQWTIQAPAGLAVGATFTVEVDGVNPDGTPDNDPYTITISPLDDTLQQATFA